MPDQTIPQRPATEDPVGAREIRGAVVGALVGVALAIPFWVLVAILVTGGVAPLGTMGILGAVKVGVAWGLVLGGYVGLLLTVRQEETGRQRPTQSAATG